MIEVKCSKCHLTFEGETEKEAFKKLEKHAKRRHPPNIFK